MSVSIFVIFLLKRSFDILLQLVINLGLIVFQQLGSLVAKSLTTDTARDETYIEMCRREEKYIEM